MAGSFSQTIVLHLARSFSLRLILFIPLFVTKPLCAAETGGMANLGQALFFDPILSVNHQQACATCHAPTHAFIDIRPNETQGAVSVGADKISRGRRNTPTLTYLAKVPAFTCAEPLSCSGGLFVDGRANSLADQASGPIFSHTEMALPSAAILTERIAAHEGYNTALTTLFGHAVVTSPTAMLEAIAASLAAFESTPTFAPYDSKYDRYLRDEITLSRQEEHGRLLFFSNLVNCNSCHQLEQSQTAFTDHSYHNIGTPSNPQIDLKKPDYGLAENPLASADGNRGKFRVPSLRNVAITAPYMHNGVFKELRTVLAFYNKYLMQPGLNPETNEPWGKPEVGENISHELLSQGQPLDDYRIESIAAFLMTLTDARYEHLIR